MAADPLWLVFSVLADHTRRDIVARLGVGDATVNELAEPYDVTSTPVSKHLKVLDQAACSAAPGRPSAGRRTWKRRSSTSSHPRQEHDDHRHRFCGGIGHGLRP